MKNSARIAVALLASALASAPAQSASPKAAKAPEAWQDQLVKGADPKAVAGRLPATAMADLQALNALRLRLKSEGKEPIAQAFFAALAARKPSDEALLNLSLAYVDQMMGKNLLQQGNLSSRSQDAVVEIIKRNPKHWLAWYIRGLNNLYWPDWFRKAGSAQEYLTQAVALHGQLSPQERDENDGYALGYLALGDAYALQDQPAEARKAWQKGVRYYPYVPMLRGRLAIPDGELHAKVRAMRDADKPIDTDLAFMGKPLSVPFTVNLVSGTLFGPGALVDQALKPGRLANLNLGSALNGFIPAFNNRGAEPNLPGEVLQGKTVDGLLSDGAEANEHVDVGHVSLMNGRFSLFLAAVQDGPSKGVVHFFLDDGWHWTIYDDIAIDPGFPVGVIKIQNFTWSTSPRVLPYSRQTEAKAPAGVDQSGSIKSGEVVPGRLGDDNFDGKLDGVFNAIGRFPYDAVILPGSPFSQIRVFETDIPLTSAQATWLTFANALSHLRLAIDLKDKQPALAASLRKDFAERLDRARRHAEKASLPEVAKQGINGLKPEAGEAELCAAWTLLQAAAPASDLRRRDFNASGVKLSASCANMPSAPTAAK